MMESFLRLTLLVLVLAAVASLSEAACRQMTLNSHNYNYNRQTVSGAARVTSMSVVRRYSRSQCAQGASFGFYGPDVWVNRGCRARFNVCFASGSNTEVTCSSNNYAPRSCHVASNIRSVAVKRHVSNSPCVQGFSFRVEGSNLVVLNGCRARFVVGYAH